MNDILEDFSKPSLIAANKANLFANYHYYGRSTAPTVEFHDGPEFKWLLTGLPYAFLNSVLHTRLNSRDVSKRIAETLAYFKTRNVKRLSWWVEPGSEPSNLGEHLEANGLTYSEGAPGMAVDLQALNEDLPSPSGLAIKTVTDEKTLKQWSATALIGFGDVDLRNGDACFEMFKCLGFDLPLRNYVGYFNGKPVATSQLFLGAGVAGLYWVATIPEARGKGIATALSMAPLLEARAKGYRIGILQSSPMGEKVYRRMGFREYSRQSYYVL